MVISHTNKFIFTRVPKNASTSLATFFVQNYCSAEDVYTRIHDSDTRDNNVPDRLISSFWKDHRFIHLTLQELVDKHILDIFTIAEYKTFGVIRCPYERQLSLYFFRQRNSSAPIAKFRLDMIDGFHRDDANNPILQSDYLKVDGIQLGEYWLYDNLNNHIDQFIKEKGKPKHQLNSYKSQFKPKDQDLINQYYDDKTREAVYNYYKADFDLIEQLRDEYRQGANN